MDALPPGITDPEMCTYDTCPIELGYSHYRPTIPGNVTYLAIFAVLTVLQFIQGLHYKTWGFMIGMVAGGILEVIGYGGRIKMYENVFQQSGFLMQLIPLTIGPAFLSAAIYLCLGRVVCVYGRDISRFRPATYTITFVTCDLISLILQAAGGALASTATTQDDVDIGVNVMIAGLVFQVFSLLVFLLIFGEFLWRVKKSGIPRDPNFERLRRLRRWKLFLWSLFIGTITIFIRCIFRVVELNEGFDGPIAYDEVGFMILEGPMIIIMMIVVTVWHPGFAFAGRFNEANFSFGKKNDKTRSNVHQRQTYEPKVGYASDNSRESSADKHGGSSSDEA